MNGSRRDVPQPSSLLLWARTPLPWRRWQRFALLAILAAAGMVVSVPPAFAACHAFTITATPTTVTEGGTVTVTVKRDGALNPSSVDVRTTDGSARSGQDFTGGRKTMSFTTETAKSYTIAIINDTTPEAAETFGVQLVTGSGSGCAINPNFSYGPPVTITIRASDQPAATSPPSSPPAPPPGPHASSAVPGPVTSSPGAAVTTPRHAVTATGSAAAIPAATTTALNSPPPQPTSSDNGQPLAHPRSDDNGGPWIPIMVIGLVTVLAGGATYLYRLRRARP